MRLPGPGPADPLALPGLPAPVALLERALDYTRPVLAGLRSTAGPELLGAPTPCRGWTLGRLLAHMDDGLAAFDDGAGGAVGVAAAAPPSAHPAERVDSLCRRSGHLLGRWSSTPPAVTLVDGVPVPTGLVALTAALEVAVHGWDVAASTHPHGHAPPFSPGLARDLLSVAAVLVDPADRGVRFAAPPPGPAPSEPTTRLLAALGRDRSRPLHPNTVVPGTGRVHAS